MGILDSISRPVLKALLPLPPSACRLRSEGRAMSAEGTEQHGKRRHEYRDLGLQSLRWLVSSSLQPTVPHHERVGLVRRMMKPLALDHPLNAVLRDGKVNVTPLSILVSPLLSP